jgi:hypothetical protein
MLPTRVEHPLVVEVAEKPAGGLELEACSCFASDGGGWIVCSTGKSADRQEPNAVRTRQDLAPRRRPDPDDVVLV